MRKLKLTLWILLWIALLAWIIGTVFLLWDRAGLRGRAEFEIGENRKTIAHLRAEVMGLQYYESFYNEFVARIHSIQSRGYRPDSLLIFGLQRELKKYPSLKWADADTILRYETGFGQDTATGVFGEKMRTQVDTATLKFYVFLCGGDVSPGKFNPEDYNNIKSSWEWYPIIAICIKARNGEVDYKYWYNGIFTKLNKLNKAKWEKYLEERRNEIVPMNAVGGN